MVYIDGNSNEVYNAFMYRIKINSTIEASITLHYNDRNKSDLFVSLQWHLYSCIWRYADAIKQPMGKLKLMPQYKIKLPA